AIEYHERALALREKVGNQRDIAHSLDVLGSCYKSLGQYEKGVDHFKRALALNERVGNPQDIANSLENLGSAYEALGQYGLSLESFERCLTFLHRVPRRTQSQEGRAAFLAHWISLPRSVSSVAFAARGNPSLHAIERGFPLVESFLGRTALESLQE